MNATGGAGAEGVRWDLTLLAPSEQAMKERLEAAVAAAASCSSPCALESIAAIERAALAELLRELAELRAARMEGERRVFLLAMTDGDNRHSGISKPRWTHDSRGSTRR